MNILFAEWDICPYATIKNNFETLGHTVLTQKERPRNFRSDPKFRISVSQKITQESVSCMFSLQFYPILADICNNLDIPYICWCTSCPAPMLYHKSVFHDTNYIFTFDSSMLTALQQMGISHCYYLPLAVNPDNFSFEEGVTGHSVVSDFNFVGSLYTQDACLTELSKLSHSTLGYLDGILQGQQLIYGYPFLENLLTPDILSEFQEKISFKPQAGGMETYEYIYSELMLSKVLTRNERVAFINKLDSLCTCTDNKIKNIILSFPEKNISFPNIESSGAVADREHLLSIFQTSKITLNITNRCIHGGIPQKIYDAMAAGSLVLSNFQPDMETYFQDGIDYICYENENDMLQKALYYLEHEEQRQTIVQNARKKVLEQHTCFHRAKKILDTIKERLIP